MNDTQVDETIAQFESFARLVKYSEEMLARCSCPPPKHDCHHGRVHARTVDQLAAARAAIREALRSKACPECGRKGETK